jgi:hypothetical protein
MKQGDPPPCGRLTNTLEHTRTDGPCAEQAGSNESLVTPPLAALFQQETGRHRHGLDQVACVLSNVTHDERPTVDVATD